MKLATLSTTLLACALACISATALPEQAPSLEGSYKIYIDESDNEVTDFIPWNELGNKSFVPVTLIVPASEIQRRSGGIEKRAKKGCHGASITRENWRIDEANNCMQDQLGDPFVTESNRDVKYSCVRSGVRSFVCSYGGNTLKYKNDLRGTSDG